MPRVYSKRFKTKALKKAAELNSVKAAAKALGVPKSTLWAWRRAQAQEKQTDSVPPPIPWPKEPTTARPGSEEKIQILEERAARGEWLFHPEDSILDDFDYFRWAQFLEGGAYADETGAEEEDGAVD